MQTTNGKGNANDTRFQEEIPTIWMKNNIVYLVKKDTDYMPLAT